MCNFPESSFFDPTTRTRTRTRSGQEQEVITNTETSVGSTSFGPEGDQFQTCDSIQQLTLEDVQAILTTVSTGSTLTSTQSQGICVKKEPSDELPTSSTMLLVQSTQVSTLFFIFLFSVLFSLSPNSSPLFLFFFYF